MGMGLIFLLLKSAVSIKIRVNRWACTSRHFGVRLKYLVVTTSGWTSMIAQKFAKANANSSMHPSNHCEQPHTTMVKPQHEDCDDTFVFPGITAPSFSLGAWGDKTAQVAPDDGPTFVFSRSCCRDSNWDDDDDNDGDDDSECWSVASYQQSVECDDAAINVSEGDDDSVLAELDTYLAMNTDELEDVVKNRPRKVNFCHTLVSDVRYYERAAYEDYKNLYYTAHELQRMIDEYVAQGGTALLV